MWCSTIRWGPITSHVAALSPARAASTVAVAPGAGRGRPTYRAHGNDRARVRRGRRADARAGREPAHLPTAQAEGARYRCHPVIAPVAPGHTHPFLSPGARPADGRAAAEDAHGRAARRAVSAAAVVRPRADASDPRQRATQWSQVPPARSHVARARTHAMLASVRPFLLPCDLQRARAHARANPAHPNTPITPTALSPHHRAPALAQRARGGAAAARRDRVP